jgi:hypothetical protein
MNRCNNRQINKDQHGYSGQLQVRTYQRAPCTCQLCMARPRVRGRSLVYQCSFLSCHTYHRWCSSCHHCMVCRMQGSPLCSRLHSSQEHVKVLWGKALHERQHCGSTLETSPSACTPHTQRHMAILCMSTCGHSPSRPPMKSVTTAP